MRTWKRIGRVVFDVRRLLLSIEHVVRAHVEHLRAGLARRLGHRFGALGIDLHGPLRIALRAVHIGVGGTVKHGVRGEARESTLHGAAVGYVEPLPG